MKEVIKHVVSFKLAKKLYRLGAPQDSLYYWNEFKIKGNRAHRSLDHANTKLFISNAFERAKEQGMEIEFNRYYSAFTVGELGIVLPEYIDKDYPGDRNYFLEMYKDSMYGENNSFLVRYVDNDGCGTVKVIEGFNEKLEAEARGKMYAYLLENKYI